MYAPSNVVLDIDALSGLAGSISIACWIVVYSPQIIENFRRSSADALSLLFVIIWTAGDLFNLIGSLLQGVLPTMIILAVYYTFADVVLLGQCLYYKGFTLKESVDTDNERGRDPGDAERQPLLNGTSDVEHGDRPRQRSASSFRDRLMDSSVDATHLSPANPKLEETTPSRPDTLTLRGVLFNVLAIIVVCALGALGWWIGARSHSAENSHKKLNKPSVEQDALHFNLWGQISGYVCAALYLGSRFPQLLLNYRRKSTEGISMLFFLFACIGNLTYVLSIFAYAPICEKSQCRSGEVAGLYWKYIAVNASWLLGSFGTFLLDLVVFVQFWMYRNSFSSPAGEGGHG